MDIRRSAASLFLRRIRVGQSLAGALDALALDEDEFAGAEFVADIWGVASAATLGSGLDAMGSEKLSEERVDGFLAGGLGGHGVDCRTGRGAALTLALSLRERGLGAGRFGWLERDGTTVGSWVAASPEDPAVGISDDDLAFSDNSGSHGSGSGHDRVTEQGEL